MVAVLTTLVGCAKTEMSHDRGKGRDIAVSVKVESDAGTKSMFDGDSHIIFEKGDGFYAAVAKPDAPATAIQVASKAGAAASVYASKFLIEDADAVSPVFNGNLYSIVEADFAEKYLLYGLFPANYSSYHSDGWADLTSWTVEIPSAQKSTQTSWSEDADIMIIKPVMISTSDNTFDEKYSEYTTTQSEPVRFAHLFGFGKFTFEGVPAEYADEIVKNVTIESVGENKDFVGRYKIDMTKEVSEIVPVPSSSSVRITLEGDRTTKVSEYVAWFVANPGTFDVKVTVETGKAALVFERQGLMIRRSEIAAPVVNFKETDTVESHDVVLGAGEGWSNTFSYSNIINSSNPSRMWGDGDKKMEFSIAYPDATNENYGNSLYVSSGKYAQSLASNEITGGKVVLSSAASFRGMKKVMLNLGNSTADVTNDFTVKVSDGGVEHIVGTVSVTGSSSNFEGTNFYFDMTPESEDGQLIVVADNFSNTKSKPYIGNIVINPAPEIVLDVIAVKTGKEASDGEIGCKVILADSDPVVSDDADWLETSYVDGKVLYTVQENTGVRRTATITVTATGLSETVAEITLTQASATAMECQLTVTAADMWTLIQEAMNADPEATVAESLTGKFEAVAMDGSGKTVDVDIVATNVALDASTEEVFKTKSGKTCKIYCASSVGAISKVEVVSDRKISSSNFADLAVKLSSDGSSWTKATSFEVTGDVSPYTNVVTNENDDYIHFSIEPSVYSAVSIYSFKVTFIAE